MRFLTLKEPETKKFHQILSKLLENIKNHIQNICKKIQTYANIGNVIVFSCLR